jgi:hypothetical protein
MFSAFRQLAEHADSVNPFLGDKTNDKTNIAVT